MSTTEPETPDPSAVATSPEPVRAEDRILALDVIRGFALFGILFVNLEDWFRTSPLRYRLTPHPFPGTSNRITEIVQGVFFDGKFMSLFSALFAVGLAIQMERMDARGARFWTFALRRLGFLFLFGIAHVVLLWTGDILHIYAIGGLVLLLFLRRKPKTISIAFVVLYLLPFIGSVIASIVRLLRHAAPSPPDPAAEEAMRAELQRMIHVYGTGSYAEILPYRLHHFAMEAGRTYVIGFSGSLTMFMVGLTVWRKGILQKPSEHVGLLRRTVVLGGAIGIVTRLGALIPPETLAEYGVFWARPLLMGLLILGTPLLALAYGAGLLLLLMRPGARAILAPLSAAGRMALTSYLMQSLLASLVFYGYGLGLYDRLGPAAAVPIVIAIFGFQVIFSRFWLSRFRYGPVEQLWRSLTYGKRMPMT